MQDFDPDARSTLTPADIIDPSYLPATTPDTGYDAMTARITDNFMMASRNNLLGALKAQQSDIWHYEFDWAQAPAPWNTAYGAAHAFDLAFLFGNFGPSLFSRALYSEANRPGRVALSDAMMASIAGQRTTSSTHAAGSSTAISSSGCSSRSSAQLRTSWP